MNIFDVLNSIEFDKKPWAELDDDFKKAYSQFMLNRLISSKKQYLPIIAKLSTMKLSDDKHYAFLCSLINKQKHYFDYKSYKQNKLLDALTVYSLEHEFEIGYKDAMRYADILTDNDLKLLCKKWKNHYDTYK